MWMGEWPSWMPEKRLGVGRRHCDFSLNCQNHYSHRVLTHAGLGRPQVSRVSHWADVATRDPKGPWEKLKVMPPLQAKL